jgi:hypothetical protein
MERVDFHVVLEVCEIVIESATLAPIVFVPSVVESDLTTEDTECTENGANGVERHRR